MGLLQNCCVQGEKKYDDNITRTTTLQSAFESKNEIPFSEINVGNENPIEMKTSISKYRSPYDDYEIIGLIGYGVYGKVFKIKHKINSKIKVMKVISGNSLKKNIKEEDLIHEIKILKSLSHQNLVKLNQVYRDEDDYFFISNFCNEENLTTLINKYKKFPEIILRKIMKDIFSGIYYLHINEIIHGNIKIENILLFYKTNVNLFQSLEYNKNNLQLNSYMNENYNENNHNNNIIDSEIISCKSLDNISNDDFSNHLNLIHNIEKYHCKLIDYGYYNIFNIRKKFNIKNKIDNLCYSSPEVLKNAINKKSDIWSCGVIMYYLLTGELPFKGENESETYEKIINGEYYLSNKLFKNISYEAKDLINKCLIYEPDFRISSKDALSHPFFQTDKEIEFENSDFSYCYITSNSKFFIAILVILIYNYSNKINELIKIKENFDLVDLDKDGIINNEEFKNLIKKFQLNDNQFENVNNNLFYLYDIIKLLMNINDIFDEINLKFTFKLFEKNNNNKIPLKEINKVIGLEINNNKDFIAFLLKEINKTEYDEFTFNEFKCIIDNCKIQTLI